MFGQGLGDVPRVGQLRVVAAAGDDRHGDVRVVLDLFAAFVHRSVDGRFSRSSLPSVPSR